MITRNSNRLPKFSHSHPDATEAFVLSSDGSEVEQFEAKYGAIRYGGSNAGDSKQASQKKRGHRGKLERIQMLPLDVVLEIYSYLEPLDVLHLSRASKDIRTFLMTQSNAIVWRKARSNVPDLPPLPSDLSEPRYANLAFESYCHICMRKPCENIVWQCRVRCCNRCFSTAFYSRPNLHSVWNRSYASTFIVFDKIAPYIPHVSVTPWKGPWGGEDKVYFPPNVKTLRHEFRKVRTNEVRLEDWVASKKQQYAELMEHAAVCSRWQKANHDMRTRNLQLTRSRRKDAIYHKLRALGWDEEIDMLEADGNTLLSSHKEVRQSKDLTDKAWIRIQPDLVRLLAENRSRRAARRNNLS